MKKALLYGLMGIGLSILPAFGAICSQTDWLTEPVIAADYEGRCELMTPLEDETDTETYTEESPRRPTEEELMLTWWEFDHANDPDLPDGLEEACYIYGEMFCICPEFLEAICDKETGGTYKENIKDSSGSCWGPMQISIRAQRDRIASYGLTNEDMLTYDGAMLVAASYLAELFEEYEDPAIVLMKYNGASSALKEYKRTGELNYYTSYVLGRSRELEERHEQLNGMTRSGHQ